MSKRIKNKNKTSPIKSSEISPKVAEVIDDSELKPYSIGFKYFSDRLCVLKQVEPKISRKVHEIYRRLGQCFSSIEVRNLPYDVKPINNSNHYTKYFKSLTEDTEVHEFDAGKCQGTFFFDEHGKIIQMLAIDHHPEDKKNKR